MKKIVIPILLLISIYSIYYDLNIGTLPTKQVATAHAQEIEPTQNSVTGEIPAESIVVEPGYTVLSIVEELHNEPVNASIQQIIVDFETLNPGTTANKIQIGKAYLFPVYRK
ncbi:hypothetical protein H1D32_19560 [Anaerobacillus sp. CMMVII]|uniref:hypothetical protein n=1 Tax=Anaerobacillus sp. CMMVII TaxID=2755588 RepID=UPI0021B7A9AF|nr:hypothetical protein [Anaerobacillus sp. CMMVII]MCT8139713.1 hypothetical protein [Anaerobacillus sp. CMMVII]